MAPGADGASTSSSDEATAAVTTCQPQPPPAGGGAPAMGSVAVPAWRSQVVRALKKNRHLANAKYVQLATVRQDGRPANRTVVFRCGGHVCTRHGGCGKDADGGGCVDAIGLLCVPRHVVVCRCAWRGTTRRQRVPLPASSPTTPPPAAAACSFTFIPGWPSDACRGFLNDGDELTFVTDRRSRKVRHGPWLRSRTDPRSSATTCPTACHPSIISQWPALAAGRAQMTPRCAVPCCAPLSRCLPPRRQLGEVAGEQVLVPCRALLGRCLTV